MHVLVACCLTVAMAACSGADDGEEAPAAASVAEWGPMAVVQGPLDGVQEAFGGEGELVITPECVVLRTLDGDVQLIWRAGEAWWDARNQAIAFVPCHAPPLLLPNGAAIAVGGGGPSDNAVWVKRPNWCPGRPFVAQAIELLGVP